MDRVLKDMQEYALPYLDDIAIFSGSWEDHLSHLRQVFTRLNISGLTVKAEKCQLGRGEVSYLSHKVGQS